MQTGICVVLVPCASTQYIEVDVKYQYMTTKWTIEYVSKLISFFFSKIGLFSS